MDPLSVLYIALAFAVLILAVVVSIAMWGIRRNVEHLAQRLDESLRQIEMTSEDLRKTHASIRDVVSGLDRAVSNVTHFTEGVRALRGPVDIALKVLDHSVSPAMVGFAGGLAGIKAAVSHIFRSVVGKEEKR